MPLRQIVLGLLIDQPRHVYALKRALAPGLPPAALINDGVLYPLLARMDKEGVVLGTQEVSARSGKTRKIYRATEAGTAEFRQWLAGGLDEADEVSYDFFLGHPFLVKMQFFKHLSPKQRKAKLLAQLESARAKLEHFEQIMQGIRERKVDPFRISLLELGIRQQQETVRWLEEWTSQAVTLTAARSRYLNAGQSPAQSDEGNK